MQDYQLMEPIQLINIQIVGEERLASSLMIGIGDSESMLEGPIGERRLVL